MRLTRLCEGCTAEAAAGVAWCCFRYLCPACRGTRHQCADCGEGVPIEIAEIATTARGAG